MALSLIEKIDQAIVGGRITATGNDSQISSMTDCHNVGNGVVNPGLIELVTSSNPNKYALGNVVNGLGGMMYQLSPMTYSYSPNIPTSKPQDPRKVLLRQRAEARTKVKCDTPSKRSSPNANSPLSRSQPSSVPFKRDMSSVKGILSNETMSPRSGIVRGCSERSNDLSKRSNNQTTNSTRKLDTKAIHTEISKVNGCVPNIQKDRPVSKEVGGSRHESDRSDELGNQASCVADRKIPVDLKPRSLVKTEKTLDKTNVISKSDVKSYGEERCKKEVNSTQSISPINSQQRPNKDKGLAVNNSGDSNKKSQNRICTTVVNSIKKEPSTDGIQVRFTSKDERLFKSESFPLFLPSTSNESIPTTPINPFGPSDSFVNVSNVSSPSWVANDLLYIPNPPCPRTRSFNLENGTNSLNGESWVRTYNERDPIPLLPHHLLHGDSQGNPRKRKRGELEDEFSGQLSPLKRRKSESFVRKGKLYESEITAAFGMSADSESSKSLSPIGRKLQRAALASRRKATSSLACTTLNSLGTSSKGNVTLKGSVTPVPDHSLESKKAVFDGFIAELEKTIQERDAALTECSTLRSKVEEQAKVLRKSRDELAQLEGQVKVSHREEEPQADVSEARRERDETLLALKEAQAEASASKQRYEKILSELAELKATIEVERQTVKAASEETSLALKKAQEEIQSLEKQSDTLALELDGALGRLNDERRKREGADEMIRKVARILQGGSLKVDMKNTSPSNPIVLDSNTSESE